jgi:hypothetical protein
MPGFTGMQVVSATGPYSITLPSTVTSVYVLLAGAGGGGGGAPDDSGMYSGQQGGSAAVVWGIQSVPAGATISGTVGSGGAGGAGGATPTAGSAGGDTTFAINGTVTITAGGGQGGAAYPAPSYGANNGVLTGFPDSGGSTGVGGISAPITTGDFGAPGGGSGWSTLAAGQPGDNGGAFFMW